MKVGSWRMVPKNVSKWNSDEAVLPFSMKRTEDKADNIFKKKVSVRLTKSSDEDKRRLHKYYLQKRVELGSGTKFTIILTKQE